MVTLVGSEKQVAWAEQIRAGVVEKLTTWQTGALAMVAEEPAEARAELTAFVERAVAGVLRQSNARFWIERRSDGLDSIIAAASCGKIDRMDAVYWVQQVATRATEAKLAADWAANR